jgi:hypothetical protein
MADVKFQLLDSEFLVADDSLNEIPDRYDSDQASVLNDGQMSNFLIGHNRHALFDRLLKFGIDDVRFHNGLNGGGGRRSTF